METQNSILLTIRFILIEAILNQKWTFRNEWRMLLVVDIPKQDNSGFGESKVMQQEFAVIEYMTPPLWYMKWIMVILFPSSKLACTISPKVLPQKAYFTMLACLGKPANPSHHSESPSLTRSECGKMMLTS